MVGEISKACWFTFQRELKDQKENHKVKQLPLSINVDSPKKTDSSQSHNSREKKPSRFCRDVLLGSPQSQTTNRLPENEKDSTFL